MNRIKKWLVENFLPRYAKESLIEENRRLQKELDELRSASTAMYEYGKGLEFSLRHMPVMVVYNHESKKRDP